MSIKNNVLFVDDEEFNLKMIKRVLFDKPYNLYFAENGREALEILRKYPIKVVLTDLEMPEMNGIDLVEVIQKTSPDIVKIVLTGNRNVQNILATINHASIFRYIVKPIDFKNELIPAMEEAIELYDFNVSKRNNSLNIGKTLATNTTKELPKDLLLSLLKSATSDVTTINGVVSKLPYVDRELSQRLTLDICSRNDRILKNLSNINDILTKYFE